MTNKGAIAPGTNQTATLEQESTCVDLSPASTFVDSGLQDPALRTSLERVTRVAVRSLPGSVAAILLVGEHGSFLPEAIGEQSVLARTLSERVRKTLAPVVLEDGRALAGEAAESSPVAFLGVPIFAAEQCLFGVLSVCASASRAWTQADVETLQELSAMLGSEVRLRVKTVEKDRALAVLRASEKQFQQLTGNIPEVFWITAPTGEMTYVSPTYEQVWQRSRAELCANPQAWIESVVAEDRARVLDTLAGRPEGERGVMEYRITRPDGSVRWLRDRSFPIVGESGAINGVCGMAEDITAQKQAETALSLETDRRKRAERQLTRAQRLESVGTLASGLAHDLNNILAPIMMSAPLLRADLSRRDHEELLLTIERSAERAAVVIRQVLTFARGMDGASEIIRPKDLLNETSRVVNAIFPRNICVQIVSGPQLHRLPGDTAQLNRVLLNLCLNARDAMPEGGTLSVIAENCEVNAELAAEMPGLKVGSHVRIRVKDSGTGIPQPVFEHIFDPFFTTKPLGKGAGLGLSSALGIVRSHQGFIDVRSMVGQGTVFDVYLPACASEIKPKAVEKPVIKDGQGELVLIVDDEKEIRSSTATALAQRGYRTLTAADGTEALALFAQHHGEIDLVLTDVMMPVVDGVALCRALRKMAPKIPIVATTGAGDEGRMKELRAVSLSGLISKPYGTDLLLGALHDALKTERAVAEAAA